MIVPVDGRSTDNIEDSMIKGHGPCPGRVPFGPQLRWQVCRKEGPPKGQGSDTENHEGGRETSREVGLLFEDSSFSCGWWKNIRIVVRESLVLQRTVIVTV